MRLLHYATVVSAHCYIPSTSFTFLLISAKLDCVLQDNFDNIVASYPHWKMCLRVTAWPVSPWCKLHSRRVISLTLQSPSYSPKTLFIMMVCNYWIYQLVSLIHEISSKLSKSAMLSPKIAEAALSSKIRHLYSKLYLCWGFRGRHALINISPCHNAAAGPTSSIQKHVKTTKHLKSLYKGTRVCIEVFSLWF